VGPGEPHVLIERLITAGAEVVALRQGERGALVQRADSGETWQIPAYSVPVVDPTGAGNAFCGGFVAGWVESGDLRQAGLCGVVAASFLLEQVGLPATGPDWREEARRRLLVISGML
jgi:sugar/nucleoside kinase (ribokinase family)